MLLVQAGRRPSAAERFEQAALHLAGLSGLAPRRVLAQIEINRCHSLVALDRRPEAEGVVRPLVERLRSAGDLPTS